MEINRKYIYILLGVLLVNIITMNILMEKDKERLLLEQSELAKGIFLFNEGASEDAIAIFEEYKDKRYSEDFVYNIYLARMYVNIGEYEKAKDYYQIAYNINPVVLNEEKFMEEINEVERKIHE